MTTPKVSGRARLRGLAAKRFRRGRETPLYRSTCGDIR